MSSDNPSDIDGLPEVPETKVMYSEFWQSSQTGRVLMRIALPEIIHVAEVEVIYEQPPPKQRIYEARVSALKLIPSRDLVLNACSMLRREERKFESRTLSKPWGVRIGDIGNFTPSAARLLRHVVKTKKFVEMTQEMLTWIDEQFLESDREFVEWLRDHLLDTPGIMRLEFPSPSSLALAVKSLFFLMQESYLDDEILRDWNTNQVKSGQIETAFAVVHMPGHWGALEVDFVKQKISFGDSLSWPVSRDAVEAIREWLRHSGVDMHQWDYHVERFVVPRQPAGSGSCAVNALNAIEKSVNPATKIWDPCEVCALPIKTPAADEDDINENKTDVDERDGDQTEGHETDWDEIEMGKPDWDETDEGKTDEDERDEDRTDGDEIDEDRTDGDETDEDEDYWMRKGDETEMVNQMGKPDEDEDHLMAHATGFELIRKQSSLDKEPFRAVPGTITRKKDLDPEKHRKNLSKRIGCPFSITVRSPQKIAPCWRSTSVNLNHNHNLKKETLEFNRINKQLSKDKRPNHLVRRQVLRYRDAKLVPTQVMGKIAKDAPRYVESGEAS
ncbi:hypothetical protein BGX28_000644, partial [Mortierella sp. GBA30]